MEKLIIVDDEDLTRYGMRDTIDWAALGFEVVGLAEDGLEGLKMARELKPDLIISDVRMPNMDGLEMAKILFEENADLAIIVYSGYKDFEYARRAIYSGIGGFLLKPIENEELIKYVKDVMQKLHKKRKDNQMMGQFRDNIPIMRKRLINTALLAKDNEEFRLAAEQLALLDVRLPANGLLVYCRVVQDLGIFSAELVRELAGFKTVTEIFDEYAVVIVEKPDDVTDESLLTEVRAAAARVLDEEVKRTSARYKVGISRIVQSNYSNAFKKAEQIGDNILFSAINTVAVEGEENKKIKELVRGALTIIEEEYGSHLTIKSVADKLFTSESYLMHEFKAETGKTFNECLTEYRILKAQEMFLNGSRLVKEVAHTVGYNNVKYFGQVFRERTGMTPSEYIISKTL